MTSATKHLAEKTGPADVPPTVTEHMADIPADHAEMVDGLVKPGGDIADALNTDLDKGNALLGTVRDFVESGNCLDLMKKWTVYGKEPDGLVFPSEEGEFNGLEAEQAHLLHMAVGIAGEASELLEAVLAHIDGDRLDRENCIEELGDIEFYMHGFRSGITVHRDETLEHNITKLGIRYKGHEYSDEQAHDRADKA